MAHPARLVYRNLRVGVDGTRRHVLAFGHMNTHTPTGLDLKLERVAQRVTGRAIAHAMGVSSSRIGHVEASAVVTHEMAARYRAALATCVEERTSGAA